MLKTSVLVDHWAIGLLLVLACGCDTRTPVEIYNDERQALEWMMESERNTQNKIAATLHLDASDPSPSHKSKLAEFDSDLDHIRGLIRVQSERVIKSRDALGSK